MRKLEIHQRIEVDNSTTIVDCLGYVWAKDYMQKLRQRSSDIDCLVNNKWLKLNCI
jgi:hypothetical protein